MKDIIFAPGGNCPFSAFVSKRKGTYLRLTLDDVTESYGVLHEVKDEDLIDITFNVLSTDGGAGEGKESWKHWKLLIVPMPSISSMITKEALAFRAQIDIQVS